MVPAMICRHVARMALVLGCLGHVTLGVGFIPAALAQEGEGEQAEDPASQDTDALARRIFRLGSRAYEEENFGDAANYFDRAFDLSGRAELMYNIGIARERNGQRTEAMGWFERYLNELPTGVRVDEVRVRLDVLRRAIAEEQAGESEGSSSSTGETEVSRPAAANTTAGGGMSPLPGWVLVGSGGALLVGGTVMLVLAGSASSTVEDAEQGTPWVDVEGDYDNAGLFSALGATGIGLGGAMVAGGLVWVLLSGDEGDGGDSEGPDVAFGLTGVTLSGRF